MAENDAPLPSCVLMVSLQCCKKCPIKVKRRLQQINGVLYINIDTKKGLVVVSGSVDPLQLQKTIAGIGKRAKILVYEEDPKQAKEKIVQLFKIMERVKGKKDNQDKKNCCGSGEKNTQRKANQSCCCVSDSDSDDESDGHYVSKHLPQGTGQKIPVNLPGYGMVSNAGGFGWHGQRVADSRLYAGYHGLPPEYARPYYASRPFGYSSYPPATYSGPQLPPVSAPLASLPPRLQAPLSNIYAIYSGQKEPPAGNSLFHSFSDDNVSACNIM